MYPRYTQRHTQTQTHRHTDTHKHTNTQILTHTCTRTRTHTKEYKYHHHVALPQSDENTVPATVSAPPDVRTKYQKVLKLKNITSSLDDLSSLRSSSTSASLRVVRYEYSRLQQQVGTVSKKTWLCSNLGQTLAHIKSYEDNVPVLDKHRHPLTALLSN